MGKSREVILENEFRIAFTTCAPSRRYLSVMTDLGAEALPVPPTPIARTITL